MLKTRRGFTLIELLVVVAVIALLIAILVPSLSRAKQMALTANCLSNLRQCGMATQMYANDFNSIMPYPTTTLDTNAGNSAEPRLWFNAVDPYLASLDNTSRSGVAGSRAYTKFKQCPIVAGMLGGSGQNYGSTTGAQNDTTEYTRTYKMNNLLRRYAQPAIASAVPHPSNFVLYGDGIGIDIVGLYDSQVDSGKFSMEVNEVSASVTPPALRHLKGACFAFVDGHAERDVFTLLTPAVALQNAPNTPIDRWQSEYIDGSGKPYNPGEGATSLPSGVVRNPNMPLQWSDVGNLYRN
jgi:prepilin-type N-terminal cleavage/methylation domain-containing protein/prepilin-type processing-associated H-X9-DG protein